MKTLQEILDESRKKLEQNRLEASEKLLKFFKSDNRPTDSQRIAALEAALSDLAISQISAKESGNNA